MLNKDFLGSLVKHTHVHIDSDVFVRFGVKHTSDYTTQNFLDSLEDTLNVSNIRVLFRDSIQWRKIVIDTSDWIGNKMNILFDETEFDAKLVSITVTRKTPKNGGDETYEYVMEFIKEVGLDNEDAVFAKSYLKVKEEDENGKKHVMTFNVEIKPIEQ